MKKFNFLAVMAVVLTLFSACQQEELEVNEPQIAGAREDVPDVYTENGYLAFKNMSTVDSVMNVLSGMSREQKDAWDAQMGFKSARADFEKLFDEYEQLNSQAEFLAFKEKYRQQLTFNDTDPEDNSIDYPFVETIFSEVLNKDGIMKVGYSLYVFSKDNYKIILDGDITKIDQMDRNIITVGQSSLKSSSISMIHNFPEDHPNGDYDRWYTKGKRRLLNELKFLRFVNKTSDGLGGWDSYEYGYKYYLKQRAQKKRTIGGWNDYKTTYRMSKPKFMGGQGLFVSKSSYASPEVKPNADFHLDFKVDVGVYREEPSIDIVVLPNKVSFSGITSCRGIDPTEYLIDHIEHTGWDLDAFENPVDPKRFYWDRTGGPY